MAKTQGNQETLSNEDFAFGDEDFFSIGKEEKATNLNKVIKGVKDNDDFEDDDNDDEEVTKLSEKKKSKEEKEEPSEKKPAKVKAEAKVKTKEDTEDEDEGEEEEVDFSFGKEEKGKTKDKKKEKVEEDSQDEDEEEEAETKAKPSKEKKKEEDNEDEDENENEEEQPDVFEALSTDLIEKGYFANIKIEEGKKVTEEKFFELFDEEIDARVAEVIEQIADEDVKAIAIFKKKGGKLQDYLTHMVSPIDFTSFDVKNKKQVAEIVNHYVTTVEGLDGEDLEDRVKYLAESGKLETSAEKWFTKLKTAHDNKQEAITKAIEEKASKDDENAKQFSASISELLGKTDKVGSFKFTKEEQKDLAAYITRPTAKIGANKYVPPVVADINKILRGGSVEDRKALLVLAKLVKSKFQIKDLEESGVTEKIKEVRSNLSRYKETGKRATGSKTGKVKALADEFS